MAAWGGVSGGPVPSLNRSVAREGAALALPVEAGYLARFEAEATAVAKLNHPNIVHVYTLGHVDQIRFIAMEYVEGTNLRDYINKKGLRPTYPSRFRSCHRPGRPLAWPARWD